MIVLLSKNTWHTGGARWEMKCAIEEKKQFIEVGMHIKKNDKGAIPTELKGKKLSYGHGQILNALLTTLKYEIIYLS